MENTETQENQTPSIISLYPLPRPEWQAEFDEIFKDKYMNEKYHRSYRVERFRDLYRYVNDYLPQINGNSTTSFSKLKVLDIGPGMGEFLELCRGYGHEGVGIDCAVDASEMGLEYMKLAVLMAERQKLDIRYEGFDNWVEKGFSETGFDVINSQGSFDQVCKKYLIGEPHLVHKNSKLLEWDLNNPELETFIVKMFNETYKALNMDGVFMIYTNASKNQKEFAEWFMNTIKNKCVGFELVQSDLHRIFKFQRVVPF